ncbi:hypothetical protein CC85DRAFT_86339 [Cutaneotrichosporon oleaginosum]|uniref:Uncharacterized protein n=1 Tax=Cutaneotrichosporon oleaginosum TaxID=879819 RepID=A0A0J0XXL9_9TREE|nr:uncharacterized protein CC85DRAFT_86339 [Cutaneotrichosporon oleaginosum]KLT45825.1 hypothetical protein CC85DRAFT_86339 [Cutaneotrichosporon oleaginosum]TXT06531.1 hypothetical protein COLE_05862 [Cutaneotrichosporon oleaginosum]
MIEGKSGLKGGKGMSDGSDGEDMGGERRWLRRGGRNGARSKGAGYTVDCEKSCRCGPWSVGNLPASAGHPAHRSTSAPRLPVRCTRRGSQLPAPSSQGRPSPDEITNNRWQRKRLYLPRVPQKPMTWTATVSVQTLGFSPDRPWASGYSLSPIAAMPRCPLSRVALHVQTRDRVARGGPE